MQKNEQEARLKILEDKLKEPGFSEKFLSFEKIEDAHKFCEENGVSITVEELRAVLDSVNNIASRLDLEKVSGGVNIGGFDITVGDIAKTIGEDAADWAKEHPVETGVIGTAVVYSLVTDCVKMATKGRHDYTPACLLQKGINAIKSKISGK